MTDDDASLPLSVNLEPPEQYSMAQAPPSHAIMSISTLMDISPTSSGSSDYPRTLADQVGGRELTLTYKPKGDRPQQPRAPRGISYNG